VHRGLRNRGRLRILVTGGAGFVGANVGIALAQKQTGWELTAFDNLKRRGSELNLPRLRDAGVSFVHGDVRVRADVLGLGPFDAIVECSAEPSALAGREDGGDYVVNTNLLGAHNCLELARRDGAYFVFLSTSRVYPVAALNEVKYVENETRFAFELAQELPGVSEAGISEQFPLDGARTLYGTSKLAAELLIAEFAESFGVRAVVDRFGVLAGPWQMGKVDQGVFTFWVLSHRLGRPLQYIGYRGSGKQVRDLLHIDDAVDLIERQLLGPEEWAGFTGNVGGGLECSLSLLETTEICRELTGNEVPVEAVQEPRPGDVPIYISDCDLLYRHTDWRPSRGPREILEDINSWISDHEAAVKTSLG
jgi:CDP-paratose 2-epimerase